MFTKITLLLLAFQNNPGQGGFNQNLNFWLVIAGLLIIFFCLVSVFVPNIKALVSSPQEFSGLGVNMKVSILTVFVLMGFILSVSSFALQWRGFMARESSYQERIRELEIEQKESQERELRSRKFNMSVEFKPKGLNEVLDPSDWECVYFLENPDGGGPLPEAHSVQVHPAKMGKSLKVILQDLTQSTRIYSLKLRRTENGRVRVWSVEGITPLRDVSFEVEPVDDEEDNNHAD